MDGCNGLWMGVMDYELAYWIMNRGNGLWTGVIESDKARIPGKEIIGCAFHWGQAFWRHVQVGY